MGWLPITVPRATSEFNGGRSQIQSNFIANGGDFPFKNLLLTAQSFALRDNTGWPTPDQATTDGYPVFPVTNTGWTTQYQMPTAAERPGNYIIVTNGSGSVAINGIGFTSVSGLGNTITVPATACAPTTSGGIGNFYIQSVSSATPLTYMAVVHENDITGLSSDNIRIALQAQPFGDKFLQVAGQANAGVLRFLNWQNGNDTIETRWATRKPTTHWSYAADQLINQTYDSSLSRYVGYLGTTGGSNNYTISDSSGVLAPVDKQTITVTFNANSVTCSNGSSAQISWTGHGLSTGDPFLILKTSAGTFPTLSGGSSVTAIQNFPGTTTFFAIVDDANTVRFSTSIGNALSNVSVTTASSGSGLLAQATVFSRTVTGNISDSTIIFSTSHLLATANPVAINSASGGGLCTPLAQGGNYYVILSSSAPTNVIKLATSSSNATANIPITFSGSFSGTLTLVKQPTLNYNGTGAIPIKSISGLQVNTSNDSNGTRPLAKTFGANTTYGTLVYDADLVAWLLNGSTDGLGVSGINSGAPPEICFAAALQLRAHPWFVGPFLSLDAGGGLTDYMTSLMQYVRDNKPSWMIPRFEGYNENWNFITRGTQYSICKAFAHWQVQEYPSHNFVGRYSSLLGQAASTIFGGAVGANCHVVIGIQAATFFNASGAAASDARLTAANFVASGPTPPVGYAQQPAYQWCSHVSPANYFTPNLYGSTVGTAGTNNEVTMANAWVAGGSLLTDPLLSTYADTSVDAVFNATFAGTVMTVTSVASGQIMASVAGRVNVYIYGGSSSIPQAIYTIASLGTGTGGAGTYNLSGSPGNGSFTNIKCGLSYSQTGDVNLATVALTWGHGTAQAGGAWGGGLYSRGLCFYEGGYSPDFVGSDGANVNNFRWASKYVADVGSLINGGTLANGVTITGNYPDMVTVGGIFPSCFIFSGGNGSGNNPGGASQIWAVLDPTIYLSPQPPQFLAIAAYNA